MDQTTVECILGSGIKHDIRENKCAYQYRSCSGLHNNFYAFLPITITYGPNWDVIDKELVVP